MPPTTVPGLQFRRGRLDDWPAVAPIVAETWEGNDYIHEGLWSYWVADQRGPLVVATLDDQLVAFGKLTHLGPAEWWLEGLRVASAQHGKGIARALHNYMVTLFREIGSGMLRFATASDRVPIHRIAAEAHFRHIMSYAPLLAPPLPGEDITPLRHLKSPNIQIVSRYLARSPMYRVNRYVERHWTLFYLTNDRLADYLAQDAVEVVGWRTPEGRLGGLAILFADRQSESDQPPDRLHVGYLDAADDTTLTRVFLGLRALAATREYERVSWRMPLSVGLERLIPVLGLERQHDQDFWLYELPLNP